MVYVDMTMCYSTGHGTPERAGHAPLVGKGRQVGRGHRPRDRAMLALDGGHRLHDGLWNVQLRTEATGRPPGQLSVLCGTDPTGRRDPSSVREQVMREPVTSASLDQDGTRTLPSTSYGHRMSEWSPLHGGDDQVPGRTGAVEEVRALCSGVSTTEILAGQGDRTSRNGPTRLTDGPWFT
jgi:hypothetical protein